MGNSRFLPGLERPALPATPRKRPRQERSLRTVERILEAAARIFDAVGYAAANTNLVAEEAGLSIGSLYQYFPNKDALLVGLAERHVGHASAVLDAYRTGIQGRPRGLDQLARELLTLVVQLHEEDRLHVLLAHEAPRTAELQAQLDQLLDRIVGTVAAALVAAGIDDEAPLTARLLVTMADAAVHDVILRASSAKERTAAMRRTIELIIRSLDRPVRPPASRPARGVSGKARGKKGRETARPDPKV